MEAVAFNSAVNTPKGDTELLVIAEDDDSQSQSIVACLNLDKTLILLEERVAELQHWRNACVSWDLLPLNFSTALTLIVSKIARCKSQLRVQLLNVQKEVCSLLAADDPEAPRGLELEARTRLNFGPVTDLEQVNKRAIASFEETRQMELRLGEQKVELVTDRWHRLLLKMAWHRDAFSKIQYDHGVRQYINKTKAKIAILKAQQVTDPEAYKEWETLLEAREGVLFQMRDGLEKDRYRLEREHHYAESQLTKLHRREMDVLEKEQAMLEADKKLLQLESNQINPILEIKVLTKERHNLQQRLQKTNAELRLWQRKTLYQAVQKVFAGDGVGVNGQAREASMADPQDPSADRRWRQMVAALKLELEEAYESKREYMDKFTELQTRIQLLNETLQQQVEREQEVMVMSRMFESKFKALDDRENQMATAEATLARKQGDIAVELREHEERLNQISNREASLQERSEFLEKQYEALLEAQGALLEEKNAFEAGHREKQKQLETEQKSFEKEAKETRQVLARERKQHLDLLQITPQQAGIISDAITSGNFAKLEASAVQKARFTMLWRIAKIGSRGLVLEKKVKQLTHTLLSERYKMHMGKGKSATSLVKSGVKKKASGMQTDPVSFGRGTPPAKPPGCDQMTQTAPPVSQHKGCDPISELLEDEQLRQSVLQKQSDLLDMQMQDLQARSQTPSPAPSQGPTPRDIPQPTPEQPFSPTARVDAIALAEVVLASPPPSEPPTPGQPPSPHAATPRSDTSHRSRTSAPKPAVEVEDKNVQCELLRSRPPSRVSVAPSAPSASSSVKNQPQEATEPPTEQPVSPTTAKAVVAAYEALVAEQNREVAHKTVQTDEAWPSSRRSSASSKSKHKHSPKRSHSHKKHHHQHREPEVSDAEVPLPLEADTLSELVAVAGHASQVLPRERTPSRSASFVRTGSFNTGGARGDSRDNATRPAREPGGSASGPRDNIGSRDGGLSSRRASSVGSIKLRSENGYSTGSESSDSEPRESTASPSRSNRGHTISTASHYYATHATHQEPPKYVPKTHLHKKVPDRPPHKDRDLYEGNKSVYVSDSNVEYERDANAIAPRGATFLPSVASNVQRAAKRRAKGALPLRSRTSLGLSPLIDTLGMTPSISDGRSLKTLNMADYVTG